jgi:predicted dehydrogenase
LKDLGLTIDQAVYLFGFPQSVYADIRTTREHSLVDDWTFIVLYNFECVKAGFLFGAIPAYAIHGKRVFPETAAMKAI